MVTLSQPRGRGRGADSSSEGAIDVVDVHDTLPDAFAEFGKLLGADHEQCDSRCEQDSGAFS